MKYRITLEVETKTGEYDLQFSNLTNKSAGIDYEITMKAFRLVINDFEKKTGGKIELGKENRSDN